MNDWLVRLTAAADAIDTAGSRLDMPQLGAVRYQLGQSSAAIGKTVGALRLISLAVPGAQSTLTTLNDTKLRLDDVQGMLQTMDTAATEAKASRTALRSLETSSRRTLRELTAWDSQALKNKLTAAEQQVQQVENIDANGIQKELLYLAAAVPALDDIEISRTLKTLDTFIAGQVIPGERIQLLVDSRLDTAAAKQLIYEKTGPAGVSIYTTALGVIEPNPRGEIYQILAQVQAVLAAFTALAITVLCLLFDHTVVMSFMRQQRMLVRVERTGWRRLFYRLQISITAPERQYGMAAGAVLLSAMFYMADGAIPYLPWYAVPCLGAGLGMLAAAYTEKINPLSQQEVMAGFALGLSFDQIMREIVIPSGRPGLLQKLNTRHVVFGRKEKRNVDN